MAKKVKSKASKSKASKSKASKSKASKSKAPQRKIFGNIIDPQVSVQPKDFKQVSKQKILELTEQYNIDSVPLEQPVQSNAATHQLKSSRPKPPLTLLQLQESICDYFKVKDTAELLERCGSFKLATDGMDNLKLSDEEIDENTRKESWKLLYRKLIGILPEEENQQGYGCIGGIDIFAYFKPWRVFQLEAKTASRSEIKAAYYRLSKIYHPDVPNTGDANIFDRLTVMYKSITAA
jgi:hypothetical protein